MRFEDSQARWLIERHHFALVHLTEALQGHVPDGGVDLLLTGFRSFTQDADGRPKVNPTSLIMQAATERVLARPGNWLPDVGLGRIGRFRCVTITANTDYNSPAIFAEACRLTRPRIVLATGLGGSTTLETAAINQIQVGRHVYDENGVRMDAPRPLNRQLTEDMPEATSIPLPWGQALQRLKAVVRARWQDPSSPLGSVQVAKAARFDNDYICNATAWMLANLVEPLSGRLMDIRWVQGMHRDESTELVLPPLSIPPQYAGFVHFAALRLPRDGYEQFALTLLADLASACCGSLTA